MLKRWTVVSLVLAVGCTIESGGEQSPIFAGDGLIIADEGSGRTVSVDPGMIPTLPTCANGELVMRTAEGWSCTSLGESFEADPSVNEAGKLDLTACADGAVLKRDSGAWSCAAPLSLSEADVLLATTSTIAALESELLVLDERLLALEGELQTRRYPVWIRDDFARDALGGPLVPNSYPYFLAPSGGCGLQAAPAIIDIGSGQKGLARKVGETSMEMQVMAVLEQPRVTFKHTRFRAAVRFGSTASGRIEFGLASGINMACAMAGDRTITLDAGPAPGWLRMHGWPVSDPMALEHPVTWNTNLIYYLEITFLMGSFTTTIGTDGYGSSQLLSVTHNDPGLLMPAAASAFAIFISDNQADLHNAVLDVSLAAMPGE